MVKATSETTKISRPNGHSSGKAKGLSAFTRAMLLLEAIVENGPIRFSELEDRLKLPKASLHRALNELILERLVKFDERSLTYSSGFRILELANAVWSRSDIRSLARDQLEQLCAQAEESAHLAVLADTHAVYIDAVESDNNVRTSMSLGNKAPVYCSGTGKVLLAWRSAEEQKDILGRISFAEYTSATITQTQALMQELDKIRQQGFAEDNEEHFAGICCVAAPIVDRSGSAVAAISISAPTFRVDKKQRKKWQDWLCKSANIISRRLAPTT